MDVLAMRHSQLNRLEIGIKGLEEEVVRPAGRPALLLQIQQSVSLSPAFPCFVIAIVSY